MFYDVFNGDADGILSLLQLRLSEPRPNAVRVTGRKRDITLLDRVPAKQGDHVTVLDISMRSNQRDLLRILDAGADVFYVDHHNSGDIPAVNNLTALIDLSPEMCTAILVDDYLSGAHRTWAVTAAFGDNFPKLAREKAAGLDLPLAALDQLGKLINYNGYGATLDDLFFHPDALYQSLLPYPTPMAFLADKTEVYATLENGYYSDLRQARDAQVMDQSDQGVVIGLADCAASRRISGVYGNQLAQDSPEKAHAILTQDVKDDSYLVSIRAPLARRSGADILAMQFETGGGRAAAAGINRLPRSELSQFIKAFRAAF